MSHCAPCFSSVQARQNGHTENITRLHLADGSYGECQRCGEQIEPARMQALPAAEFCLACAGRFGV